MANAVAVHGRVRRQASCRPRGRWTVRSCSAHRRPRRVGRARVRRRVRRPGPRSPVGVETTPMTIIPHHRFDGPDDAPVLVLSNSLGTDLHMWDPQMEVLTRRHRVLRYDQRGHGQSPTPPGPYSIDELAGRRRRAARASRHRKGVVLRLVARGHGGHGPRRRASPSGSTASWPAARRPGSVRRTSGTIGPHSSARRNGRGDRCRVGALVQSRVRRVRRQGDRSDPSHVGGYRSGGLRAVLRGDRRDEPPRPPRRDRRAHPRAGRRARPRHAARARRRHSLGDTRRAAGRAARRRPSRERRAA